MEEGPVSICAKGLEWWLMGSRCLRLGLREEDKGAVGGSGGVTDAGNDDDKEEEAEEEAEEDDEEVVVVEWLW